MRYLAVGLVLGMACLASADPLPESAFEWRKANDSGTFLEIGGGLMHTARDGVTYDADYVRFAPQVSVHRWFYVGAGFEVGHIYGSTGKLDGMLPTPCTGSTKMCTGPGNNLLDETTGSIIEPQVFIGVRDRIGNISGGFEVAPTVRWTSASTNFVNQTFTTTLATLEFHARADFWATPRVNAGLMVGGDLGSWHDLMAGLQIGFHFEPYDLMNR